MLMGLGKIEEAKQSYEKSLDLEPKEIQNIGILLKILNKLCSWDEIEKYSVYLKEIGIEGKGVNPLELMYLEDNPENHLKRAINYNKEKIRETLPNLYYQKKDKINIAYFSSDFRNHPVSLALTRILELHDQSKFKIYAYSLNEIEDDYTKRVNNAVSCFRKINFQ